MYGLYAYMILHANKRNSKQFDEDHLSPAKIFISSLYTCLRERNFDKNISVKQEYE